MCRLDLREETILISLDDGNAGFDPDRSHAYAEVGHTNGGVHFYVNRTWGCGLAGKILVVP